MTDVAPELLAYPMQRTCPFDPAPGYAQLRDRPALSQVRLPTGALAWAVTRYEHIRAMLSDARFSSDLRHPGYPILVEHQRPAPEFSTSLIGMDPPEHTLARRTVAGEFTHKRLSRLRPRIQSIVDEHIERLLAGPRPVDLVHALALPVPLMVICELIGVPFTDRDFFLKCSATLMEASSPEEGMRAFADLMGYMDDLVTRKESEPGDDVISRLAGRRGEPGVPDHRELVAMAFMLLMAGHETPANLISLGTLLLLEHPDQLAAMRTDPAKTPMAVDELLRYFTITEVAASRVATEDIELGGVVIKAGEGALGLLSGANRDPARFTEPDVFDIDRGDRHHLAFGFGFHQCLGQHLARIELQIAYDTLFARIPDLRLAEPVESLRFKEEAFAYGLYELPVTWGER
jgi:cytochrome P450